MSRRAIIFLAMLVALIGKAEKCDTVSRPVTQVYMLETGGRQSLETYLSPLVYKGVEIDLSGNWSKVLPWMQNSWVMNFDGRAGFSRLLNKPGTAAIYSIDGSFQWGAAWRTKIPGDIHVTAGGAAGISAGVSYLPGNSNNPANARADIYLALTASASRVFRLGRLPVLVSDRLSLPSLSLFFSPQYGETYFEIYLGNRSGLAHCGWWGNHFRIDNLLTFDLDIGPSALRLGYRFCAYTSWIENLNTHIYSHSFVIGWIPHGLGLKSSRPSEKAITIHSLY